ncbi:hypothetical protein GO755_34800 [Spirosoma sp. HMF4905]|uniref:AntA/AntB antirepressor domain-containing protein n=1 Tax=Spirosoma arboris TaxID=2682092 RepID=A0A7K1SNJ9_9BACT|nr:antA/AntB antirepressor family protein [Spirosoma arboris]MVM35243.1 hypothetical protein [Spirosoma arboris]
MNELIQITTDEQGPKVKSARELYGFLEVKSKFADWFKNRVHKYGFVEGQDFVTLSKNLENGGRELDYALTLDMAKELAMVERTEKGKEARLYFIEKEKQLRQLVSAPTNEQLLIQLVSQQTQLMADYQQQLASLRADVESIRGTVRLPRPSAPPHLKRTPLLTSPSPKRPASDLRQAVKHRVNEYCGYHGAEQGETYNYLYKRLNEVWSVNVYRLIRLNGESLLDAIERYGYLDKMYGLIMAELKYVEE